MIILDFEKYSTDDFNLKSIIIYFKNGLIYYKLDQWVIDNRFDIVRIDDLRIDYMFNVIDRIVFLKNGKLHNYDGFAFKYNGSDEYYINDQELSFEQWKLNPERIKAIRKNKFKVLCKK